MLESPSTKYLSELTWPFTYIIVLIFRYEDSEKMLLTALTLYELCAPPHSNFTMFAKSVYAIVLKVLGKMEKTIIVAMEVIEQTGELFRKTQLFHKSL